MRKNVGKIDDGLLAAVDVLAAERGQTRRVLVERALRAWLREDPVGRRALEATQAGSGAPEEAPGVSSRPPSAASPRMPSHAQAVPVSSPRVHAATCRCAVCVPPK